MRREGIKIPEAPETLGPKDLSQGLRDLKAAGYNLATPEGAQAARVSAKLEESPASIGEREARTKEEAAKNERELKEEADKNARELKEQLAKEQRGEGTQKRLIDYRESKKPAPKSPEDKQQDKDHKAEVNSVLEVRREGSEARKKATPKPEKKSYGLNKGAGDDFQDVEAGKSFTLPPPLPLSILHQIRDIALEAADAGLPPEDVTATLLDTYDQMRRDGIAPSQAVKLLRSKLEKRLSP